MAWSYVILTTTMIALVLPFGVSLASFNGNPKLIDASRIAIEFAQQHGHAAQVPEFDAFCCVPQQTLNHQTRTTQCPSPFEPQKPLEGRVVSSHGTPPYSQTISKHNIPVQQVRTCCSRIFLSYPQETPQVGQKACVLVDQFVTAEAFIWQPKHGVNLIAIARWTTISNIP